MHFNLPQSSNSPIKVIGVGGGGSNAVNTMYQKGINGVDFIVCNTDAQALDISPVPRKVQLGATLTGGQGAGSLPEVGKNAAIESLDEVLTSTQLSIFSFLLSHTSSSTTSHCLPAHTFFSVTNCISGVAPGLISIASSVS